MLEEKDLRKISEELMKLKSEDYGYLKAVNLIFNSIEIGIGRTEPSASDIYEKLIKTIIYEGEINE